ncbi:MAG: ATP-binding protein [Phycisphaeraceae bacterium]|nr:ATP-binding protein [Phycisphaeraceae bacterium]
MSRAPAPMNLPPPAPNSQGSQSAQDFARSAESRPEIALQIMSNPLYLSGTREMVAGVARRLGFSEEVCSQIALAVDEALCNVIRHGYGRAADRPIWISVFPIPETGATGPWGDGCLPEAIKIVIEDEARQVDPSVIKSRDLEEIRPGGLGVHIIQTVMDAAVFERRSSVGMRLTMVKKRQSGAGRLDRRAESAGGGCCDCGHSNTGSDATGGDSGTRADQSAKPKGRENDCGQ